MLPETPSWGFNDCGTAAFVCVSYIEFTRGVGWMGMHNQGWLMCEHLRYELGLVVMERGLVGKRSTSVRFDRLREMISDM